MLLLFGIVKTDWSERIEANLYSSRWLEINKQLKFRVGKCKRIHVGDNSVLNFIYKMMDCKLAELSKLWNQMEEEKQQMLEILWKNEELKKSTNLYASVEVLYLTLLCKSVEFWVMWKRQP